MESVETVGGPGVKDRRPKKRFFIWASGLGAACAGTSFRAAHAASCRVRARFFEGFWRDDFQDPFKPGTGRAQGDRSEGLEAVDRNQC